MSSPIEHPRVVDAVHRLRTLVDPSGGPVSTLFLSPGRLADLRVVLDACSPQPIEPAVWKIPPSEPRGTAVRWWKNGDHPHDHPVAFTAEQREANEGAVVRRFRRPDVPGGSMCSRCGHTMHEHGWIDTHAMHEWTDEKCRDQLGAVCPGDWVLSVWGGEHYVVPHALFRSFTAFETPGAVPGAGLRRGLLSRSGSLGRVLLLDAATESVVPHALFRSFTAFETPGPTRISPTRSRILGKRARERRAASCFGWRIWETRRRRVRY